MPVRLGRLLPENNNARKIVNAKVMFLDGDFPETCDIPFANYSLGSVLTRQLSDFASFRLTENLAKNLDWQLRQALVAMTLWPGARARAAYPIRLWLCA